MKNIFEGKKKLIVLGVLLLIIAVVAIAIVLVVKNDNDDEVSRELKEDTYTMYVSINPLVKFEFVETYYECTNMTTKDVDVCSEYGSKVVSFDLVNDDAKEYFKDIDFTDMNLIDVLSTMRNILIEQDVEVELFSITTDWNLRYTKEELISEILANSNYENEFTIEIDFEDVINEEENLENNTDMTDESEKETTSSSSMNSSSNTTKDNSTTSSSNTNSNTSTSTNSDSSSSTSTSGSDASSTTSCTPKKFSNTYTYIYETEAACKAVANDIFYDIYDNVDSRVELWSCDEIVDECGTTWYGISFQIYDNGYQTVHY